MDEQPFINKVGIVRGRHAEAKQERAVQMRREMTPAEQVLWQQLRANRLGGLAFRRQQIIDGFIVDFYCHAAGLVVELDGAVHDERKGYDTERDRVIARRGLQVLRFPNRRVEQDLPGMLDEIQNAAEQGVARYERFRRQHLDPPPGPLPRREGEEMVAGEYIPGLDGPTSPSLRGRGPGGGSC